MLVLTRRRDERIMIGDDIIVSVDWVGEDRVRLGIVAPRETTVHREEVYEKIRRQTREGGAA